MFIFVFICPLWCQVNGMLDISDNIETVESKLCETLDKAFTAQGKCRSCLFSMYRFTLQGEGRGERLYCSSLCRYEEKWTQLCMKLPNKYSYWPLFFFHLTLTKGIRYDNSNLLDKYIFQDNAYMYQHIIWI